MSNMITLALSKGRIFDETLPMLAKAGITVSEDPESSRKLILPTSSPNLRFNFKNADDLLYDVGELVAPFSGSMDS